MTLLQPRMLNLGAIVHAQSTIKNPEETAHEAFEAEIQEIPEIVECYSISGDKDYMQQRVAENVEHYDALLKKHSQKST